MGKFYVTTAIPYANSAPHIGFAMEAVQADFLARYHRLIGDDTYFLTGTDEHGIKIAETAQKLGQLPQEHVDHIADLNMRLKDLLNLSYDDFILKVVQLDEVVYGVGQISQFLYGQILNCLLVELP